MAFFWAPGCSSCFLGVLGTEVNDARDGFLRCYYMALLYLAAKPAHMRVDVDGLACPLHCPIKCSHQARG
jgi:hypothetical protein